MILRGNLSKKKIIVVSFVLALFCFALCIHNRSYFLYSNPFALSETFNDSSLVAVHSSGRMAVTCDSKAITYCLNPDGEICGIIPEDVIVSTGTYTAEHITATDNGYVIHDMLKNAGSVMSAHERILAYDENGRFLRTLYEEENTLAENEAQYLYINGLTYYENQLFALRRSGNFLYLYKFMRGTGGFDAVRTLADPTVKKCLSALYLPEIDKFLMLGKDGNIYCEGDSSFTTIFDSDEASGSCASGAAVTSGKKLYYIDAGRWQIAMLAPERHVIKDGGSGTWRLVHIAAAEGIVCAVCSEGVTVIEDGGTKIISSAPYSLGFIAVRTVTWAAFCCFVILILLSFSLASYAMLTSEASDSFKSSLKFGIIMTITSCVIAAHIINNTIDLGNKSLSSMISKVAATLSYNAAGVYGDSLERISKPTDYGNEDWQNIHNHLDSTFMNSGESIVSMYYDIYKISDDVVSYVLGYADNGIMFMPYLKVNEEAKAMLMSHNDTVYSGSIDDTNGRYVYSVSPVKNSKNETVGLLEVGYVESDYEIKMRGIVIEMAAMIAVLIILVITFISQFRNIREFLQALPHRALVKEKAAAANMLSLLCGCAAALTSSFIVQLAVSCYDACENFAEGRYSAGAVPLFVAFAACAVCAALSDVSARKIGAKMYCTIGCVLMALGGVAGYYSVQKTDFTLLIAAAALFGAGFGMEDFTFFINEKEDSLAQQTYLSRFAGIMAGIAAGAYLDNSFGRAAVFIAVTATALIMLAVILLYIPHRIEPQICSPLPIGERFAKVFVRGNDAAERYAALFFRMIPSAFAFAYAAYIFPLSFYSCGVGDTAIGDCLLFAAAGASFFGRAAAFAVRPKFLDSASAQITEKEKNKRFMQNFVTGTKILLTQSACAVVCAVLMIFFAFCKFDGGSQEFLSHIGFSKTLAAAFFVLLLSSVFTFAARMHAAYAYVHTARELRRERRAGFVSCAVAFGFFAFSVRDTDETYAIFSAAAVIFASVIWYIYYARQTHKGY